MKKIIFSIILVISFLFIFNINNITFASNNNVKITTQDTGRTTGNAELESMNDGSFFSASTGGEKGILGLIFNIARDFKAVIFVLYIIIVIIIVLKLLFAENTEEQQAKMKMGILWSTIGIMVMQIAFSIYKILFDRNIGATLARDFGKGVVQPFTELLMLLASFVFISMAIYAFYKIVTAGGDDEGLKKGKQTIINAIIGFIVIKFSSIIVKNTFNPDCGGGGLVSFWGAKVCENVTKNSKIIITLINWFNTFLAIVVVLMIIYAGFLVMTSGGDEEKTKKAKSIILYSAIGLFILFASYMILTFFIIPQGTI